VIREMAERVEAVERKNREMHALLLKQAQQQQKLIIAA
jgi:hypothetical protein